LTGLNLTRLAILALILTWGILTWILATSPAPAAPLGVGQGCGCQKQDCQGAAHLY
jgi:hypothetical protein